MVIPKVGDEMVAFSLPDLEGNKHTLDSFKDKYILLSFWSLSCMICMKSAKDLKQIHEKYRAHLNVVSINMDTSKTMWEQGTSRDNITWVNLSDGLGPFDGVGKDYGIVSYPAYVLINTDGIIVDRWMGYKPGKFEEKMQSNIPNLT